MRHTYKVQTRIEEDRLPLWKKEKAASENQYLMLCHQLPRAAQAGIGASERAEPWGCWFSLVRLQSLRYPSGLEH